MVPALTDVARWRDATATWQAPPLTTASRKYEREINRRRRAALLAAWRKACLIRSKIGFSSGASLHDVRDDSLIGRGHDMKRLVALLSTPDARAVTLVGPAGVGKTRLAEAAAAAVERDRPIVRISLAGVGSASDVPGEVARALTLPDLPAAEQTPAIAGELRDHILLLDNLEHLPDVAQWLTTLLTAAAGVSVLATSRTATRIPAETVVEIGPLAADEAAALFARRARERGYDVDDDTAMHIAAAVDRLPLAIELAAARLAVLTAGDLLARLAVTTSVVGSGVDRSLRSSYELLGDGAATLFRRLAAFATAPSLAAIEAVCMAPADGLTIAGDPLDHISELVDASLLTRADRGDETRFGWLRVVRDFAAARLAESGDAAAVAATHAAWAVTTATAARRLLPTPNQADGLESFDAHSEEFLRAIRWSMANESPPTAAGELVGLQRFYWQIRGRVHSGGALAESLLADSDELSPAARSLAAAVAGDAATARGDLEAALGWAREAAAAADLVPDDAGLAAETLTGLARAARNLGDFETALDATRRVVTIAEGMGVTRSASISRCNLATLLAHCGDVKEAREILVHVLADPDSGLTAVDHVVTCGSLCDVLLMAGDHIGVVEHAGRGLATARAIGDQVGLLELSNSRSLAHRHLGDQAAALADADEARRIAEEIGDSRAQAIALSNRAWALDSHERPAVALHAWSDALRATGRDATLVDRGALVGQLAVRGAGLLPDDITAALLAFAEAAAPRTRAARAEVGGRLGPRRTAAAVAHGTGLTLDQAVDLAIRSADSVANDATPADRGGLTRRELDVVRLIARGLTDKEIATDLGCSPRTVATHVGHILAKLTVPTRTAAAGRAAELDLL